MACEKCIDKSVPKGPKPYARCSLCGRDLAEPVKKPRTNQQNRALFKYFKELADDLNGAGVDQKMFIDHLKGWEIPITKEFLHEIWKIKQAKMFPGQTSTTQMETNQVTQVYDAVNHFTGQTFGVSRLFPNEADRYLDEVI